MFCGNCGNKCEDDAVFCPVCGTRLADLDPDQPLAEEAVAQAPVYQPEEQMVQAPVYQPEEPMAQAPVYQPEEPMAQAPVYAQANTYQNTMAFGQPQPQENNLPPQGYQQAADYQQVYGQIPAAPQAPAYQQGPAYGQPGQPGQPGFAPGQGPVMPIEAPKGNALTAWGLVLGIFSLIFAVVGAPIFGIYFTLSAIVLGIVGIILSCIGKKKANGKKGTGGFVMSLLGLIFGVIFSTGCIVCGEMANSSFVSKGCVGGYYEAKSSLKKYKNYSFNKFLDSFFDF